MPIPISLQRLYQQGIADPRFDTPEAVVRWFGAVQAQDYPGAKWSLGLRMTNATDDIVEQAFTEGRVLRTHIMRPTWHFVIPEDIRWLLDLTAPRVRLKMAYYERQLGGDAALYARAHAVIAKALQGGACLTRDDLAQALSQAGMAEEGSRLIYILMQAELDGLIISGPRRGKQFTYALLEERAPQARALPRDEALAELTRRYFTAHGPATIRDGAWWSGLTTADVKAGIAMLGGALAQAEIDGQAYYFAPDMPPVPADTRATPEATLLPTYDEFLVGYEGFDKLRRGGDAVPKQSTFFPSLLLGDQVAGRWQRTFQKGGVSFEIDPFEPLTPEQSAAVEAAKQRYAAFYGVEVVD